MKSKICIVDFGSQYTQLIARRLREINVFCEIFPCTNIPELDDGFKGIILSGSPFSVNDDKALQFDFGKYTDRFPILGVCYGAQYMCQYFGGIVEKSEHREYGKSKLLVKDQQVKLFEGIDTDGQIWMSHGDSIVSLPEGFVITATTDSIPVAAFESNPGTRKFPLIGIQFHPEVTHSDQGTDILKNYILNIVGCEANYTPRSFINDTVTKLKDEIGTEKVLLGLSGGVDSSVAAFLLKEAIGDQLECFFIDNGLLRKDEFDSVLDSYQSLGLNITGVRAAKEFLEPLDGVSDPETKRKTIGRVFIEVFEREAKKLTGIKWLGQGTIYPDVIESLSVHGPSATIKSHHNVGGLPEKLDLKIVEPLRMLFKDEVRKVGKEIGVPSHILDRHPFPGPGLAIRILGEISEERVKITQEADAIFINGLKESGLYDKVWQAGAILLPVKSVGVMGDERTYEYTLALRSVNSLDGMTADWSRLPHDFLAEISNKIINQVKGINRVVYDISTKPPATIEWE